MPDGDRHERRTRAHQEIGQRIPHVPDVRRPQEGGRGQVFRRHSPDDEYVSGARGHEGRCLRRRSPPRWSGQACSLDTLQNEPNHQEGRFESNRDPRQSADSCRFER